MRKAVLSLRYIPKGERAAYLEGRLAPSTLLAALTAAKEDEIRERLALRLAS